MTHELVNKCMIVHLFVGLSVVCVFVTYCSCVNDMYVRPHVCIYVWVCAKGTYMYICRYLIFRQGYSRPCISYTHVGNLFVLLRLLPRALDEGARCKH